MRGVWLVVAVLAAGCGSDLTGSGGGTFAIDGGRAGVADGATSDGPEVAGIHPKCVNACPEAGQCLWSQSEKRCTAVNKADCEASANCATGGACSLVSLIASNGKLISGICGVALDADCERSESCIKHKWCYASTKPSPTNGSRSCIDHSTAMTQCGTRRGSGNVPKDGQCVPLK